MKYTKLIKLSTFSGKEERYILDRFPNVWWTPECGGSTFYLDISEEKNVKKAIEEFERCERNER